ncbi:MAG: PipX family protein [Leptolyngbyaceae bacterium]|nr:PipX family protein [Leptolyngbyaceae bacterium]
MSNEVYTNHPNFGLLYRICLLDEASELFATLYAQRLFFIVKQPKGGPLEFMPVGRTDARVLVEQQLRSLKRNGKYEDYGVLQSTHQQTFQ